MDQEQRWLDEYREVLVDCRHYEVLRWTVVALTYPSAVAAVAWAGDRWGLVTGRTFLVFVLASLWLLAGSLVFSQINYFGRVKLLRARELEACDKLNFSNMTHELFSEPSAPEKQPWYTQDLAFWFAQAMPFAAALVCGLATIVVIASWILGWRPSDVGSQRDTLGYALGVMLVLAATVAATVRGAKRRTAKPAAK
jgi:hypothetical protein